MTGKTLGTLTFIVMLLLTGRAGAEAPRARVEARVRALPAEGGVRVAAVSFPSPVQVDALETNTVYGWYYAPHAAGPAPGVVVLHEWGTKQAHRARALSRELAQRGVAAFAMVLPYHIQRQVRTAHGHVSMLTGDPEESEEHLWQSVLDVQASLDWLQDQPEVDPRRLGVAGMSLGAILADVILSTETRVSVGVSILGAGDLAHVYWRSPLLWKRQRVAKRHGWTLERVEPLFAPVEPATHARRVHPEDVLLINAWHDWIITRHAADDLWEAYGRPQRLWVDAGHWGAFMADAQMRRRAADFLVARLNGDARPLKLEPVRVPVRVRVGVYGVQDSGVGPGVSLGLLRWGHEGSQSVELLLGPTSPLLSFAWAPTEYTVVGWGVPVKGGRARAYIGVNATF